MTMSHEPVSLQALSHNRLDR